MGGWGSWTMVIQQATDMPVLQRRTPWWSYLHHQAWHHGSSGFHWGLTTFYWSCYSGFSLTSHFLILNQSTTSSCPCWSSSPTHRFSSLSCHCSYLGPPSLRLVWRCCLHTHHPHISPKSTSPWSFSPPHHQYQPIQLFSMLELTSLFTSGESQHF